MKNIVFLIYLASCAQAKLGPKDDLVSIQAALEQAQMSYLKGCVEGLKVFKVPNTFFGCQEKSVIHRKELEFIISQDPK